ncbi:helix-turn-helix transcriptional regulator [Ruegeria conchae]|uniref:helix-turn-helix transcriptional regulator n=1 Tax=Ruegeria conchae TaxID=981384 RepID=UPI0021A5CB4D|nr:LuxR C-terminal-related transcriptional regulator [Ruegeria conchae]
MNNWFNKDAMFKAGIAIYAISAFAFAAELVGEITGYYLFSVSWVVHEITALITLFGFVIGGVLIWQSHKLFLRRHQEIKHNLQMAQGEFFRMLELQFDRWNLSAAERDVALLTVKGLSVAEIAKLRETSEGTIKSQNNSIYRKANVKSRTQLLCVLIDELLIEEKE